MFIRYREHANAFSRILRFVHLSEESLVKGFQADDFDFLHPPVISTT